MPNPVNKNEYSPFNNNLETPLQTRATKTHKLHQQYLTALSLALPHLPPSLKPTKYFSSNL